MHINDVVFFSVSNKKQFEIWTYIFREILINAYASSTKDKLVLYLSKPSEINRLLSVE
jgi:DNA-binding transcriptional regulator WhiA